MCGLTQLHTADRHYKYTLARKSVYSRTFPLSHFTNKWRVCSRTIGFTVGRSSFWPRLYRWSLIGLAFVVFWGSILFGYDTYVCLSSAFDLLFIRSHSGIAYENLLITPEICWLKTAASGGVVSAPYFLEHFGLVNTDGSKNVSKVDDVSSNVVSVLQAGAFFGALGSAPLSGNYSMRGLKLDC